VSHVSLPRTSVHPCTHCGQTFFFTKAPADGWRCVYCSRPCNDCRGSGYVSRVPEFDEPDICDRCGGAGKTA
jgi:DnaJ-class molecular chaperone